MSQTGLSVVLPLYNGASFVKGAIDSVMAQQELPAHWEILVVDDGSSDSGAEICRRLAVQHPQIRVEQLPDNLGVATARNRGVARARYEHLGFIDQDDQWLPCKWQTQLRALSESEVDYVLGHQQFELESPHKPPHWFRQDWLQGPQIAYVLGGMLIRRDKFCQVGDLDQSLRFGGDDVDWFNRAKIAGLTHKTIDDVVLHRYIHDHNASGRTQQSNPELLRVIRAKLARQALSQRSAS